MSPSARRYPVSWPRPFERSGDPEQLRRRVLAFSGIWFLLAGMLAALGFTTILIASVALVLLGGALAAGRWLVRRYGVGERLRASVVSMQRASRAVETRLGELDLDQHRRRISNIAAHRARTVVEARRKEPTAADPRREARRLNELGAQLRREGKREEAAEQHMAALEIVHAIGDRRAEALTRNNLALALVHTGGVAVAVQQFEEALILLRELGDEEHEGQVIANLASVRRRQGRDEDADSLLTAALDKLPPESSAYRQVEEQLRRAS